MLSSSPDTKLDDWVVAAINPVMVLCKFGRLRGLTVFLNEQFNNYTLYSLDKREFLEFLKEIVVSKNISKYDLGFLQYHRENKELSGICKKFPILKRYEVVQLLRYLKEDGDMYERVMRAFGLIENDYNKSKVSKKEKKSLAK